MLKKLEQYDTVAMHETPIPQNDLLGNRQIRRRINRPVAMHLGSPPYLTAMREEVCDGFVISGGSLDTSHRRRFSFCGDEILGHL